MKVLVLFLLISFLIGMTDVGRWVRERPLLLVAFSVMFAGSYWSLAVVMG